MKFFESKYYTDVSNKKLGPDEQGLTKDALNGNSRNINENSFAFDLLQARMRLLPRLNSVYYDPEAIKKIGELVEDLTHYTCSIPEYEGYQQDDDHVPIPPKQDFDKIEVYFLKDVEAFAVVDDASERYTHVFFPVRGNSINVMSYLDQHDVIKEVEGYYDVPEKIAQMGLLVKSPHGGYHIMRRQIPTEVSMDYNLYNEDFKPVADEIVSLVSNYNAKGLIILHGEPGTGKTSFIKWLTSQSHRTFVYVQSHMVTALADPAFIPLLVQNRGCIFVVEDAEEGLGPRAAGGSSVVSAILNMSDGILADLLGCQFICTFNTELKNIDSALLRPGRLLARYEFNKLTKERANEYRKINNLPENIDTDISLAQLIHKDVMSVE